MPADPHQPQVGNLKISADPKTLGRSTEPARRLRREADTTGEFVTPQAHAIRGQTILHHELKSVQWPSCRSVRFWQECDATEVWLKVEDWPDGGCARAANYALGNSQVRTADKRSVHGGKSSEGAVPETDYARFDGHRLVATCLQRCGESLGRRPPPAGGAELLAQLACCVLKRVRERLVTKPLQR
jgi:hypothetical protein